jgi:hypothetical protein
MGRLTPKSIPKKISVLAQSVTAARLLPLPGTKQTKVFWFFFSKKNCFLRNGL